MADTEAAATACNMPVRKAKSAFLYYQGEMQSKIRAELGGASMGDVMTEVSVWYIALLLLLDIRHMVLV